MEIFSWLILSGSRRCSDSRGAQPPWRARRPCCRRSAPRSCRPAELPLPLGGLDHREADAVLHGAARFSSPSFAKQLIPRSRPRPSRRTIGVADEVEAVGNSGQAKVRGEAYSWGRFGNVWHVTVYVAAEAPRPGSPTSGALPRRGTVELVVRRPAEGEREVLRRPRSTSTSASSGTTGTRAASSAAATPTPDAAHADERQNRRASRGRPGAMGARGRPAHRGYRPEPREPSAGSEARGRNRRRRDLGRTARGARSSRSASAPTRLAS